MTASKSSDRPGLSGISGLSNLPEQLAAAAAAARRLVRRASPRRRESDDGGPDAEEQRYRSVLDLGTSAIKALLVERPGEPDTATSTDRDNAARLESGALAAKPAIAPIDATAATGRGGVSTAGSAAGVVVLAGAVVPRPDERDGVEALVAACERSLVTCEDAAGVIPRRVTIGVDGAQTLVSRGSAESERRRPARPVTADEADALVDRAVDAARAAAHREHASEHAATPPLAPLRTTIVAFSLDGRSLADPAGRPGEHLRADVTAVFAPEAELQRLAALADALDLELDALVDVPSAIGTVFGQARGEPALVLDVGGRVTTAMLAGSHGVEAVSSFPLGGYALEERLAAELSVDLDEAQRAIAAHAAGAPARFHSGVAAIRVVRRLAEHHADVWLDALELACAKLGRDRTLPSRLLLCGGAAGLPELRRALAERRWTAALPFQKPPTAHLLGLGDIPGIRADTLRLPSLQAIPAACVARYA
ncbi:MAG: hypothetical protein HY332_19620 [Chloroflexi bacterium]|nr:hypothetical protein [Chloroflexota bacterium]